jgi:hypothetical protein
MKKLFSPLALAVALASLTGCELYFGGHNDGGDDRWTYCANDGYYVCNGDDCEWAGARCPADPGYTCESNADCAAGCYCQDGVCEEAGFCSTDAECPDGFSCDEARNSCVPDGCSTSADCDSGEFCDAGTGTCTASCVCSTDQQAQDAGFGYCDETRGTCEPTPAGGSCGGTSTCATAEPTCAAGEVALISNGCYTGGCQAIGSCDVTPGCEALQHESDCLGQNSTCSSVYYGINCQTPGGTACMAGDTGCVCQSFQFAECRSRTTAMMVYPTSDGSFVDVFSTH